MTRCFGWARSPGFARAGRELLRQARGRTLELGSGTGLNVPHYPDDLAELILTEPAAPMRKRLEKTMREYDRSATVLDAWPSGSRSPTPRSTRSSRRSFSALWTSHKSCLRRSGGCSSPDGCLLFLEHVRAESPRLAVWQDRRDSVVAVRRGLPLQPGKHRSDAAWRGMPPIVHPIVSGIARRGKALAGLRHDG